MATTIQFKRNTSAPGAGTSAVVGEPLLYYAADGSRADLYVGHAAADGSHVRIGALVDTGDVAGDSDQKIPTQKAVKTYVDAQVDTADALSELSDVSIDTPGANEILFQTSANAWRNYTLSEAGIGTSTAVSTNATNIATNVTNIATNATNISSNDTDIATNATAIALKAPLAGPTFTGTPAAPTPSEDDNSTQIATTAYVQTEISGYGTDVLIDEFSDSWRENSIVKLASQDYNIIITPHIGGMSIEGQERAYLYAVEKFKNLGNIDE